MGAPPNLAQVRLGLNTSKAEWAIFANDYVTGIADCNYSS